MAQRNRFVCSDEGEALVCVGQEGTEQLSKALDVLVHLHSDPHLWSLNFYHD